jgi:hypothetical protein
MKRFASLIAVLLLVAAVTAISAQEKEVPAAEPCEAIDSETKVKVQKLRLEYELSMVDLKAEKGKLHEEMMAELLKEESSTKTIEKLGKSMNAVQYKMHKAKIDYILNVKKVLPADHWKAFLNKKHAEGMGHGGYPHGTAAKKCCPMMGAAGHKCTTACTHSAPRTGCKTPCVKVKK